MLKQIRMLTNILFLFPECFVDGNIGSTKMLDVKLTQANFKNNGKSGKEKIYTVTLSPPSTQTNNQFEIVATLSQGEFTVDQKTLKPNDVKIDLKIKNLQYSSLLHNYQSLYSFLYVFLIFVQIQINL